MSKDKKTGKHRMNKNTLGLLLEEYFKSNPGRTISFKDIFRELKLNTHPLKMLAIEIMEEMAWDDFITRMSDNSYRLREDGSQVQTGKFIRRQNGRNSFLPDEEGGKPILVMERNSMYAMDGDRVKVSFMARRKNHAKEAQVIEIIERARETFVGRLRVDDDMAFLVVQDGLIINDIIIPKKKLLGGKSDDKAVVKVLRWPDAQNRYIIGEVIDILGHCGENDAEMNTILVQYGLPYVYPKAVEDAANEISGEITEQDYAEREDYRDVFTCTIDPADAKDFDDALSIRQIDSPLSTINSPLYEIGVHIADVSHYVTEGSIIDKEAQKRATSIYLVDRTIPMLPERLCNFICSLRPDEEKLAYSVIFLMDEHANIKDYRIVHTVIKSNRRFVYDEVQQILVDSGAVESNSETTKSPNHEYAEELCMLWQIAKKLREKRFKDGAVRFESEEMKFELDAKGKPVRCYFKKIFEANNLVEEFMLLANRTVAETPLRLPRGSSPLGGKRGRGLKGVISSKDLIASPRGGREGAPFVYRIHDNPDPQKLETLKEFIVKFGYKMKSTSTMGESARALNKLMDDCSGKKEQKLIQTVALRSMMKAKYSIHNIGHFGLAFDYYTHFTSPIRRYPDTMVHRLLTQYQNGGPSGNREYYEEQCKHSSDMEQIAANAERDSIKYKAVEFMQEHLGEEYDAHISGITSYGIYCEIDENHCEGMVPMRDLNDDYYDFDERNYCLRGSRRGNLYQLGDPIRIKVARANLEKKQLDFTLAE